MDAVSNWFLTDAEKDKFIAQLAANIVALRTQADISQEELANLIGISRQTYSAIERKVRQMSWGTYMALILFFDNNQKTHKMMRALSLFPKELIIRFNAGEDYYRFEWEDFLGDKTQNILEMLDEQAKKTIHSIIMFEYARCTQTSNESVVKSFDGMDFFKSSAKDIEAEKSLRRIRKKNNEKQQH